MRMFCVWLENISKVNDYYLIQWFCREFCIYKCFEDHPPLIKSIMFEARIEEGHIFRKIVDAIKELVKSVNLEANGTGVSI